MDGIYQFAITAMLVVFVLGVVPIAATAQGASNEVVVTKRPDRADPAALDVCRSQMVALGSSAKVGQLRPLLKTSIKVGGGQAYVSGMKPVRAKDLRIYAARVENGGYLGLQTYEHVCFFEKLSERYRFIQACSMDIKTGKLAHCDLRWLRS
jgi:hypothetical protein